jgi:hypothetical protein
MPVCLLSFFALCITCLIVRTRCTFLSVLNTLSTICYKSCMQRILFSRQSYSLYTYKKKLIYTVTGDSLFIRPHLSYMLLSLLLVIRLSVCYPMLSSVSLVHMKYMLDCMATRSTINSYNTATINSTHFCYIKISQTDL